MAAAMLPREPSAAERGAIKSLVVSECANYDSGCKMCLPLDCACVMLGKQLTGGECKYFKNAVLPLDPALENALSGGEPFMGKTRSCSLCGKPFRVSGNRAAYCKDCSARARKRRQREYMRKKRR
jgi:hypothetical protein